MSNAQNDELLERAREIAESYTGTPLEDAILNSIDRGDLTTVRRLVKETTDQWMHEATHSTGTVYPGNNYER